MREKSTETVGTSSPTWETLEAFARQSIVRKMQLRYYLYIAWREWGALS